MRKRYICPGFCKNEYLAELSVEARLLFACMPMFSDREGRLEDRPKKIRAEIFPYDNFDVDKLLNDLYHAGFVDRYEVDGIKVVQIVNFSKHQRAHRNEEKSILPDKKNTSLKNREMSGLDRSEFKFDQEKTSLCLSETRNDLNKDGTNREISRSNREMHRPNFNFNSNSNSYFDSNYNSKNKEIDRELEKTKTSPICEQEAACPPPQAGTGRECEQESPANEFEEIEKTDQADPVEDPPSPESENLTNPDLKPIYDIYPRHEGRKAALRKIEASVKTIAREEKIPMQEAITRLHEITLQYAKSPKVEELRDRWKRSGENFIPMPGTWFGQERWRDGKQAWGYGMPKPSQTSRGQPIPYACELDKHHLPVEEFL